ncbi:hypothetical protein VIBHAR_02544 [Vibrio campbellii ATCC BAA-1116]|uniref:Uncharacterized protein n=1 Tax=Vibrio campbellii (strain ATCC BAA-1116) TaxID=2902295 RepID=A7N097_VIBC1|nr:hypothetical protein VIBHAR_02544 [Vibrio campbellii ATCC BAA-1116]
MHQIKPSIEINTARIDTKLLIEALVVENHGAKLIHVEESFTEHIEDMDEALFNDLQKLAIVLRNGLINLVGQDTASAIQIAVEISI